MLHRVVTLYYDGAGESHDHWWLSAKSEKVNLSDRPSSATLARCLKLNLLAAILTVGAKA